MTNTTQITTRFSSKCLNCNAPVAAQTVVAYDKGVQACPSCDDSLPKPEQLSLLEAQPASVSAAPAGQMALRTKLVRRRHLADDGYTVFESRLELQEDASIDIEGLPVEVGGTFSICGMLSELEGGDLVDVFGSWRHNQRHGWEFRAVGAVKIVSGSLQALRAFLAQLPNVGPVRAGQIIHLCKNSRTEVIDVIENDHLRLTAVSGISEERACEIRDALTAQGDLKDSALFLAGLNLGEALSSKILTEWGGKTKGILIANPYDLLDLPGVGFQKADDIARTCLSMHAQDPRRAAAAVLFLLEDEEREGHTWTELKLLVGSKQTLQL